MNFESNKFYHVYNRGNRRIPIFYRNENYLFFLEKIKRHVLGHAKVLAYCLMPNHFHLLIFTNQDLKDKTLNHDIGIMLRSFTRAINKQESQVGSLFQQATKAKCLDSDDSYPLVCFNYIHLNPLRAGLVKNLIDWEYSSYPVYASDNSKHDLIDRKSTQSLLDIDLANYRNGLIGYIPQGDIFKEHLI